VVAEMHRIGVLVDLAHVAVPTMHAALDVATAPVIFSHSSARAVTDHRRNVPDDVLARLRDNGGVVQVTFVPPFVSDEVAQWYSDAAAERQRLRLSPADDPFPRAPHPGEDPLAVVASLPPVAPAPEPMRAWLAAHPRPVARLSQVADHADHVREVAGVDHIGLGGDFDGTPDVTHGLEDVSAYPRLLAELGERGWSESDLEKLTGRNMLRVMRAAEEHASEPLWPRR
jgi:membrane dipeptidase